MLGLIELYLGSLQLINYAHFQHIRSSPKMKECQPVLETAFCVWQASPVICWLSEIIYIKKKKKQHETYCDVNSRLMVVGRPLRIQRHNDSAVLRI